MYKYNDIEKFFKRRDIKEKVGICCNFKVVILIIVMILMSAIFVIGGAKILEYHKARIICNEIRAGKEIDTNFSNGSTAPLFLDNIAAVMQIDGPKIPLVEACYYRNVQAVSVLLENGADPNSFLNKRYSPLEAVLANGPAGIIDEKSLEIVKMLVDSGCDVNKHASSETVIIQLSTTVGGGKNNEIVEEIFLYLLDSGASREIDVLHNVIRTGNVRLARRLIEEYSFDVNEKGYLGQNSLILAASYSFKTATVEMIQLLLQTGADKDLKDDTGKTAFDYAKEKSNQAIMVLLKE